MAISKFNKSQTVVVTPNGNLTSDNLQDALEELQADIDSVVGGGVQDASETQKGIVQLATVAETNAATDNTKAVTPASLSTVKSDINTLQNNTVTSINGEDGIVVLNTDDISEGPTNKYYSDALVDSNPSVLANNAKVSADGSVTTHSDVTNAGSGIIISAAERTKLDGITAGAEPNVVDSVNGQTGSVVLNTDNISEGATNLYFTAAEETKLAGIQAGAQVNTVTSVNSEIGNVVLDTSDIAENPSNLYYTEARVDANASVVANTAKVSADGSVTTHSDISSAGSGSIITTSERNELHLDHTNRVALDAVSGINTGDEIAATDSTAGIVELATQAEVDTGVDNTKAVTPASLATIQADIASLQTLSSSGLNFKGGYDAAGNVPDLDDEPISGIKVGDVYSITSAGNFYTEAVSPGDLLIAEVDDAIQLSDWVVVQANLDASSIKSLYESNSDTNAFTDALLTKLNSIQSGAEANTVDSVNGETGVVVLTTDEVSQGTTNRYYSDALVSANPSVVNNSAKVSATGSVTTHSDVTNAGSGVIISSSERTKLNTIETGAQVNTVDSVNGQNGFVVLDADDLAEGTTNLFLTTAERSKLAGVEIGAEANNIASVNGQQGTVVLDTGDIAEDPTNLYYTDARVSANSDVAANTAKVSASGSVTTHSDITSAGSGAIITGAERTKLTGIEAGAQVNTVDSVNGETGVVVLNSDDIAQGTTNLYVTPVEKAAITHSNRTALDAVTGVNTGDESIASQTVQGIVELATLAETNIGTDSTRAVTPAGLATILSDISTNTSDLVQEVSDRETADTNLNNAINNEILTRQAADIALSNQIALKADQSALDALQTTVEGIGERVKVNTVAEMTASSAPDGTTFFVVDDGDGKWAQYQRIGGVDEKTIDQDDLIGSVVTLSTAQVTDDSSNIAGLVTGSLLDDAITNITGPIETDLANAIADYIARDTLLQSDINTRALNADLNTEITNRSNADIALQANIDLKLDASTVIDEDNFASNDDTRVPTQQSTKAYVDSSVAPLALQTDLDNEVLALEAQDVSLQNQITTNSGDIAQEIADRTAADNTLQSNIDLKLDIANAVTELDDLSDVDISTTSPLFGNLFAWDGSNLVPTTLINLVPSGVQISQYPDTRDDGISDHALYTDSSGTIQRGQIRYPTNVFRNHFSFDANFSIVLFEDDYVILSWDATDEQPTFNLKSTAPTAWDRPCFTAWKIDGNTSTTNGNSNWRRTGGRPTLVTDSTRYFSRTGASTNSYDMENYGSRLEVTLMRQSYVAGFPHYKMIFTTGDVGHAHVIIEVTT